MIKTESKRKRTKPKNIVSLKKSGEGYILTVCDELGFAWDQSLRKEELLEIQKILNQKFK